MSDTRTTLQAFKISGSRIKLNYIPFENIYRYVMVVEPAHDVLRD